MLSGQAFEPGRPSVSACLCENAVVFAGHTADGGGGAFLMTKAAPGLDQSIGPHAL